MIFKKKETDYNLFIGEKYKDVSRYNLPQKFKFCKKCLATNQKPTTRTEHNIKEDKTSPVIFFDNICQACKIEEQKQNIDWDKKKFEFKKLLDKYRSRNGSYDVIVPGSGGKDSFYVAHRLKYEYKMNPLTITFSPFVYTDWGFKNLQNWINAGFQNYLNTPNQIIYRLLSRIALENLFHPWHPWILGQKNFPPKFAKRFGIPLVIYGESPSEYGNPASEYTSQFVKDWHTYKNINEVFISGVSIEELYSYGLNNHDIEPFLPMLDSDFENNKINCIAFGYFHKWHPQQNYYYTIENSSFNISPERTAGTYSKYASIDDCMDDLYWHTYFIKYGIGRTTHDVSQEIRNGDLTLKEGAKLINKFDGEYPERFEKKNFDYLSINEKEFGKKIYDLFERPLMNKEHYFELADNFRSPHLWKKTNKGFELRNNIKDHFPNYFKDEN